MPSTTVAASVHSYALFDHWRALSRDTGWSFPSDWHVPAVEAVCEAICSGHDAWAATERLGRCRAEAGVSLGETLADIDGLCSIVHPRYSSVLPRAVSLGWADRISAPPATVSDPLTGLATPEYLKVRLGELYRSSEVRGTDVSTESALVVVRLDLTARSGWQRVLPMILTADAMRTVFDAGQSLAHLAEPIAVVLTTRDELLARRARLLAAMVVSQVARDPDATVPAPKVWIENLPNTYNAALDLLAELGR